MDRFKKSHERENQRVCRRGAQQPALGNVSDGDRVTQRRKAARWRTPSPYANEGYRGSQMSNERPSFSRAARDTLHGHGGFTGPGDPFLGDAVPLRTCVGPWLPTMEFALAPYRQRLQRAALALDLCIGGVPLNQLVQG